MIDFREFDQFYSPARIVPNIPSTNNMSIIQQGTYVPSTGQVISEQYIIPQNDGYAGIQDIVSFV